MASSFRERRSRQAPHRNSGVVERDSSLGRIHQRVNFGNRLTPGGDQSNAAASRHLAIESKENSAANATNSIARPGKTPMPSTPFSLLKQEIEDDDDDQSLLCSPLVVKTKTRTPALTSASSFVMAKTRHAADSNSSREHASVRLRAVKSANEPSSLRRDFPGLLSRGDAQLTQSFTASRRRAGFQEQEETSDDVPGYLPLMNGPENATSSPYETQNRQIAYALPPSPMFGDSPCQPAPHLSAIHPKHSETPFSINKKGVCMDLSDVFCGAEKKTTTVKKIRPTPTLPPRNKPATATASHGDDGTEASDKFDESQEIMFTNVLNQILCPIDDTESDSGAFHELALQQQLSKTRRMFKQAFRSINFEPLKDRILSGKLKLREDRDVSANLGCRKDLIELLFSYSDHWLRLALETVFSTIFTSNDRTTLRNFIISRVVQDSNILKKYTHGKCKVPSGSFEASYRDELRTAVLFRILCLVCFLDAAKCHRLLDYPLFHKKAKFKSTKKLLFQFCCEFMKGEGNIVKHLSRLGFEVTVEQKATEELEFRINNIKVDLSDGVRLARLAEILSDASLIPKLRLPVVSRLQKFHNVNLALQHLQGIPKSILAHHIIDGHRQQVLRFLWSLVAVYFLPNLLTKDQVLTEVRRIQGLKQTTTAALDDSCQDLAQTLLEWSRLVCSFYTYEIHNLDTSFADGKAICYLIHYYHPYFIDLRIARGNYSAWSLAEQGMASIGGIPVFIPDANEQSITLCLSFLCSRLIETRKQVLAARAIQCLFRRCQARRLRERKSRAARFLLQSWRSRKVTYFVNQRRMFAGPVRIIEAYVSKHWCTLMRNLRFKRAHQSRCIAASTCLQRCVRSFIVRRRERAVIQQTSAACLVQAHFRRSMARRRYHELCSQHQAASTIQLAFARWCLVRDRQSESATVIQTYWRRFNEQINFDVKLLDINDIQRCIRGFLARRKRDAILAQVVHLQAIARRFQACRRVTDLRMRRDQTEAAMKMQSVIRRHFAVIYAETLRGRHRGCVLLQSLWRRRKARRAYFELKASLEEKQASVKIQTAARIVCARRILRNLRKQKFEREAATVLQGVWRMALAKRTAVGLRQAARRLSSAIVIQSLLRMILARYFLEKLKRSHLWNGSAMVVQARWRCARQKLKYGAILSSITCVQAMVRGRSNWILYRIKISCIVRIQTIWRISVARTILEKSLFSVRLVQACIRRFLSRKVARCRLAHVLKLQASVRVFLARSELRRRRLNFALQTYAATVIQRYWRGYFSCVNFKVICSGVVDIQCCARRLLASNHAKKRRQAIVVLQKYTRRLLALNLLYELKELDRLFKVKIRLAAVCIQRTVRGHNVRVAQARLVCNAVLIQSIARGYIAEAVYQTERAMIILVQQQSRQWLSIQERARRLASIQRLQCWARLCLARFVLVRIVTERRRALQETASAITLQSTVRIYLAKLALHREVAARQIQKTWRCYSIHVYFMTCVVSALEIQTWSRRYLAMCEYDRRYESVVFLQAIARGTLQRKRAALQHVSAITVQCLFRVFLARRDLDRRFVESCAANLIISFVRMRSVRVLFLEYKTAAIVLQSRYRGIYDRTQLQRFHCAATLVQTAHRRRVTRCWFRAVKSAVIKIQTRVRMAQAVDRSIQLLFERAARERLRYISAVKIQHAYLNWLERCLQNIAAQKIQALFLRFVCQGRYEKLRYGTVQLQACFRGRCTRKLFARKERLLSERVASANAFARSHPEQRLSNRSRAALAKLLRSKSLTATMKAIWVLELCTRLSYDFCASFAKSGAINILLQLMSECNRSLPHEKLQYGILLTMSNVLKYDAFIEHIVHRKVASMLVAFLHLFHDRQCLFAQTLSLLNRMIRFVDNPCLFFGADITERFHAIVEVYNRKFNHKVNMSNSRSGPILPIGEGVVLDRRSTLEMAKKMSQQLRATTKT